MRAALALALLLLAPTLVGAARAGTTDVPLPGTLAGPLAVEVAEDGDVWFTLDVSWRVGRVHAGTGRIDTYPLATPKSSETDGLYALALGGGAVWTASTTQLHRVDVATGATTAQALPLAGDISSGVFYADDGQVWAAQVTEDQLVRYDPSTGTQRASLADPGSGPLLLARAGPERAYLTLTYANALALLDTRAGSYTTVARGIQAVSGVAFDGSSVWLGEHGGNSLVRVDPESGAIERFPTAPSPYYPVSGPNGVAVARDGSIWFAVHFADRVARFDPVNRTLVEYELASAPGANVQHVSAAPDGKVWFAQWSRARLGHAEFGGETPDFAAPPAARMPENGTTRVPLGVAGAFRVGSPFPGLNATIEGNEIVLRASNVPVGDHHVLLSRLDNKTYVGRYFTLTVTPASDAPAPALIALLGALAVAAVLARRRA